MARTEKLLLGFGSKARIGKDFAADGLSEYFDVQKLSFASALKEDLHSLFTHRINKSLLDLLEDPEEKPKLRQLMVSYGSTMRLYYPDVWLDSALPANFVPNKELTIITDVRFPNEVTRLKELGGFYINIDANVPPANDTEAHNSALLYELADYRITNNFDSQYVVDMYRLVMNLYER